MRKQVAGVDGGGKYNRSVIVHLGNEVAEGDVFFGGFSRLGLRVFLHGFRVLGGSRLGFVEVENGVEFWVHLVHFRIVHGGGVGCWFGHCVGWVSRGNGGQLVDTQDSDLMPSMMAWEA